MMVDDKELMPPPSSAPTKVPERVSTDRHVGEISTKKLVVLHGLRSEGYNGCLVETQGPSEDGRIRVQLPSKKYIKVKIENILTSFGTYGYDDESGNDDVDKDASSEEEDQETEDVEECATLPDDFDDIVSSYQKGKETPMGIHEKTEYFQKVRADCEAVMGKVFEAGGKITSEQHLVLGGIFYELENYEGMIAEYEKYLIEFPNDPCVLANIAAGYSKLGNTMQELKYNLRAAAAGPPSEHLCYNIAVLHDELGDKAACKLWLRKAIAVANNFNNLSKLGLFMLQYLEESGVPMEEVMVPGGEYEEAMTLLVSSASAPPAANIRFEAQEIARQYCTVGVKLKAAGLHLAPGSDGYSAVISLFLNCLAADTPKPAPECGSYALHELGHTLLDIFLQLEAQAGPQGPPFASRCGWLDGAQRAFHEATVVDKDDCVSFSSLGMVHRYRMQAVMQESGGLMDVAETLASTESAVDAFRQALRLQPPGRDTQGGNLAAALMTKGDLLEGPAAAEAWQEGLDVCVRAIQTVTPEAAVGPGDAGHKRGKGVISSGDENYLPMLQALATNLQKRLFSLLRPFSPSAPPGSAPSFVLATHKYMRENGMEHLISEAFK